MLRSLVGSEMCIRDSIQTMLVSSFRSSAFQVSGGALMLRLVCSTWRAVVNSSLLLKLHLNMYSIENQLRWAGTHLDEVEVVASRLTGVDVERFLDGVDAMPAKCFGLDCRSVELKHSSVVTRIAKRAMSLENLERFTVKQCNLGTKGLASLVQQLHGIRVSEINLSENRANAPGAVSELLKSMPNAWSVNLAGNRLYRGLTALPPCLEILDLAQNQMTDQGAVRIATALPDSPSLRKISLYGNEITRDGVKIILQALVQHSRVLEFCDLRENPLCDQTLRRDHPELFEPSWRINLPISLRALLLPSSWDGYDYETKTFYEFISQESRSYAKGNATFPPDDLLRVERARDHFENERVTSLVDSY
eukprot:TRINITY_DN9204_c0_g1_i1.p1 TRINITY_DN9204_c0_g1~~TRINITY_DN9204_c0_g1_i1.p1  ORF type:complete len:364 (+),score=69.85 TRINITY_DN9204_c0_g1_i1:140-1231(+)